jgi:hypothetical protein
MALIPAADSESYLFSVTESSPIAVNIASANQSTDYWVFDADATSHVTGNRHFFGSSSFKPIARGEYQVKMAGNRLVDAEGSGNVSFHVDCLTMGANLAQITLQHVPYVPACCNNNLLSNSQIMGKRVQFEYKRDRSTARSFSGQGVATVRRHF